MSKEKSIKLSPKHGVNPTIPVCFFCGKEKKQLVLLGKLPHDAEAPKNMILDYEPCDDCKEKFATGITIIGVIHTQPEDKRPPIAQDLYPTGSWAVVSEDFVKRNFNNAEEIIKQKIILMDDEVVQEILSHADPSTILH